MKKLIFGLMLLLVGACTSMDTPTNTVVRASKFVEAAVPQASGNVVYLEVKNKTTDMVEILLSESTINGRPVFDGSEISRVGWQHVNAPIGKREQLTNRSADIVLAPGESIRKEIGYSVDPVEYPARVVLKVRQNGVTEFAYINLTE